MRRWLVGCVAALTLIAVLVPQRSPAMILGVVSRPDLEQGFIETDDGARLFYKRVGRGTQAVVVPGAMGLAGEFEKLTDGRCIVFYDIRGHGRSGAIDDAAKIGLEHDVRDIETIRRRIGAEKISLVGHSYLALVAVLYALEHPERVERIVQIAPPSFRGWHRYPLSHLMSLERFDLEPRAVAAVKAPVLTIHGTWDLHASRAASREWALALPNARLLTVDVADAALPSIDRFLSGRWPASTEKPPSLDRLRAGRALAQRRPARVERTLAVSSKRPEPDAIKLPKRLEIKPPERIEALLLVLPDRPLELRVEPATLHVSYSIRVEPSCSERKMKIRRVDRMKRMDRVRRDR